MKLNPELIRWLERNPGRHPRMVKPAATQEEKLERKAADCLSRLKAKAINGALPVEHTDRLTQVRCYLLYGHTQVLSKPNPCPVCSSKPSLQHLPSMLVVKSRITIDLSPCCFYVGPEKLLPTWRDPQNKGRRLPGIPEVKSKVLKLIDWCDKQNNGKLVVRHVDTKCNNIDRQKEMRAILQSVKRIASGSDAAKYADSIALMDQRFSRAWRFSSRGT